MNTYRVSVLVDKSPGPVSVECYHVDALTPAHAVRRAMKYTDVGERLTGVACQLFAKNIFPFYKEVIREVAA